MKRFVVHITTAITIVSLLAAAAWYAMSPARPADGQTPDATTADVIRTGTPIRKDFEVVEQWIGRTESKRVARIVAFEEGKLVSIDAEDQAQVEEGSALFTLGGTRLDSRLEATGEEVRSLRQRLTIAEKLVKRKESIIQQRIGRRADLEDARHQRLGLETQLKTATTALQRIEDATRIVAPFAGVFTKRTVCVGQNLSQGERLGEVIDPAHVRVIATHKAALAIPERAIVRDRQEAAYVFVSCEGGYEKQLVRTGFVSNGWGPLQMPNWFGCIRSLPGSTASARSRCWRQPNLHRATSLAMNHAARIPSSDSAALRKISILKKRQRDQDRDAAVEQ